MTDSTLTHLVLVLDRSGSMRQDGKHTEAEKGVRALLDEQVAVPGRLEVTVARFDDRYDLLASGVAADSIDHDHLRIEPRGMTALYDAVGRTVASVGQQLAEREDGARPGRVIFLVATDGLENASHEYTAARLKEVIAEQTDTYGWEFMFMGTSQEAMLQAQAAGFHADLSYASSDSAVGVSTSYAVASSAIGRARRTNAGVQVNDDDRSKLA